MEPVLKTSRTSTNGGTGFSRGPLMLEQKMAQMLVRQLTAEEGRMLGAYVGKEILAYREDDGYYYGKMTRNGLSFIELENVKFLRGTHNLPAARKIIRDNEYDYIGPCTKRIQLHKQEIQHISAVEDVESASE